MTASIEPTANLPAAEQVGVRTHWVLPAGPQTVELDGDFIGFATSHREQHENHRSTTYASTKDRCRACRWFEPRIFRETDGQERYLIHYAGVSVVPGEVTHTRVEWAHSAEEILAALSTPWSGPAQKCPVCDGTGLVSRPPGVAGDLQQWPSTGTGPYRCQACGGNGVLQANALRFTIPAQRVLAQAASFDDEIDEAWQHQVRLT